MIRGCIFCPVIDGTLCLPTNSQDKIYGRTIGNKNRDVGPVLSPSLYLDSFSRTPKIMPH